MKVRKLVYAGLLLLLSLNLVGSFLPQIEASTVDLNSLILSEWEEYDAWITRKWSINGTLIDDWDYPVRASGASSVTQTTPLFYAWDLMNMYEQTGNDYYLAKAKVLWQAIKDDPRNYVNSSQYFCPFGFWISGIDADIAVWNPFGYGLFSLQLYLATGNETYKDMADRVASESYDIMPVVNNSTDLAWSVKYYTNRTVEYAKYAVNRQSWAVWFYALYGKYVNSTFTPLVNKMINWVMRSQLASGGCSYDIGGSTENPWYTAFLLMPFIKAYTIDPSSVSDAQRQKIENALIYVRDKIIYDTDYLVKYFALCALLSAWKNTYFSNNVSATKVKSLVYDCLMSMRLTEKGLITRVEGFSFGFRWQTLSLSSIFSNYPVPDASFDTDNFDCIYRSFVTNGVYNPTQLMTGVSQFRDGGNYYGVQILQTMSRAFFFGNGYDGSFNPQPTNETTMNGYYHKIFSQYGSPENYNATVYLYRQGVWYGIINGTQASAFVLSSGDWRVRASNGTEWTVSEWSTGQYSIGNEFLIYLNGGSALQDYRTFYIRAPSTQTLWNFTLETLKFVFDQDRSDYQIIYITLPMWGDIITNSSRAYDIGNTLANSFDQAQPLTFTEAFNAYWNVVDTYISDASWLSVYKSSTESEVKLIGHDRPEQVSISSWTYVDNTLTLSISGSTGVTSTTKIYCGSKGQPKKVSGTTSYSYDSSTKILTITVTHSSDKEVTLTWGEVPSSLVTTIRNNYYVAFTLIGLIPVALCFTLIFALFKGRESLNAQDMSIMLGLIVTIIISFIVVVAVMNAVIGV